MKLILLFCLSSFGVQLTVSNPLNFDRVPRQFIAYKLTPESRNSFLDHFQNFIANIIEDGANFIKEYADQTANIVAQIQNQIEGIAALANATVEKLTNESDKLIQAWQNQTDLAINCTKVYGPLLQETAETVQQSMQICIQNATDAAQDISNAIRPNVGQLLTYIKELQYLVDGCFANSTNVFEGISCVVGKGNEIKTNILQVVMDVKTIIIISTNKGFALVSSTGKCINSAVDTYQTQLITLRDEFKNCILEGFWK